MEFNKVATQESIDRTVVSLKNNNFDSIVVDTKEEALAKIKELIPAGVSVMNGTSETLHQIGYIDFLKAGEHGWNNLHELILAEPDQAKQALLRRQSVVSDFYVGSMHALSETGEIVIASNTGSQLPHSAFTSPNLVYVVGAQKITSTLTDAIQRLNEYVVPLEDERMNKAYGFGTTHAKTLIMHKENPMFGRKITVIIVKESLGF